MEQAQYWTWTKRKRDFNPLVQSSYNSSSSYNDSSWEEQAFAEDASGHLGGCIWPPRSYSCSFCRREFRSAQALGGHMNVHRRDRARLKQSSPTILPYNEILINPQHHDDHHHDQNQNLAYNNSLEFHFPPQNCTTLVSNPNPSCDSSNVTSPSLKTSTHQENYCQKTLFPNFSSSSNTLEERQNNKRSSPRSSSLEESNMVSDHTKEGERSTTRILELGCRSNKVDCVENTENLSASLFMVLRRNRPPLPDAEEEEEEEESIVGCKKRRMEISPCSVEELDLELRLGTERPKNEDRYRRTRYKQKREENKENNNIEEQEIEPV